MTTKDQIIAARELSVPQLIEAGFSMRELFELGEVEQAFYGPSESQEYFDGISFYNRRGDRLRSPAEFNPYSEGYTPFGDE